MEVENIVSLVSSVGFPIVACVFMWRYINSTLAKFTDTMAENTRMISKLCDKLDVKQDVINNGK